MSMGMEMLVKSLGLDKQIEEAMSVAKGVAALHDARMKRIELMLEIILAHNSLQVPPQVNVTSEQMKLIEAA